MGAERGKRTLLLFISTGCASCAHLMPSIQVLAKEERKSLEVILVAFGVSEEDARRFATEHHLDGSIPCAAFLIENLTTCYSLSLWAGWDAIPHFGTNVPYHVEAARRVFGRVAFTPERGPEVWSTKFRLSSVSNNLNWVDFDLRELIIHLSK